VQPDHVAIERDRAVEVGHGEVDAPDVGAGVDRSFGLKLRHVGGGRQPACGVAAERVAGGRRSAYDTVPSGSEMTWLELFQKL
jgi:hypothetical protein